MPFCGSEGCQAIVFGYTEKFHIFRIPVSLLAKPYFYRQTQQLLPHTLCKIGLFSKMSLKGGEIIAQ